MDSNKELKRKSEDQGRRPLKHARQKSPSNGSGTKSGKGDEMDWHPQTKDLRLGQDRPPSDGSDTTVKGDPEADEQETIVLNKRDVADMTELEELFDRNMEFSDDVLGCMGSGIPGGYGEFADASKVQSNISSAAKIFEGVEDIMARQCGDLGISSWMSLGTGPSSNDGTTQGEVQRGGKGQEKDLSGRYNPNAAR